MSLKCPAGMSTPVCLAERPDYRDGTLRAKLMADAGRFVRPLILFTDIDGTYVTSPEVHQRSLASGDAPPGRAIDHDLACVDATALLTQYLVAHNQPLIAVTGRDLALVLGDPRLRLNGEPIFDVVAADVGTILWVRQGDGTYAKDSAYEAMIVNDIGFVRDEMYPLCVRIRNAITGEYPHLRLRFQPRDRLVNVTAYAHRSIAAAKKAMPADPPQPYKISYHFEGSLHDASVVQRVFLDHLARSGKEKVKVVTSHDRVEDDGRTRFNLDVVPVDKNDAITYMVRAYGGIGVVAGDSGNDEVMVLRCAASEVIGAVVVGGMKAELRAALDSMTCVRRTRHFRVIQTPGGERLVYVEPGARLGPQSLLRAMRMFRMLLWLSSR